MATKRKIYTWVVLGALRNLPFSWVEKISDELLRLRYRSQEILRQQWARGHNEVSPVLLSYDGEAIERSVLEKDAPWLRIRPGDCNIPGMLSGAERQYYIYISKYYSGVGAVVEVGPWLGLSTYYILAGLNENPYFDGKRLHVYDDFVWRSAWMDKWLKGTNIIVPANHESFLSLYKNQIGGLYKDLDVLKQKICDYEGNESLPLLEWSGGPTELLIVDCGRSLAVNEGWWKVFSGSFIKDKTIIVMQDWQTHKAVPEIFWENTKIFTDSKGDELELIHELRQACTATFIYRGGK